MRRLRCWKLGGCYFGRSFNRANIVSGAAATVEVRARDRCVLCGSECDDSASDTSPLPINGWFELKVNLHRKPPIHGKVLDEQIVTRFYFLGHNGNIDAVMFSTLT